MAYIKYEDGKPVGYLRWGSSDLNGWTYVTSNHADIDKVINPIKYFLEDFLKIIRSKRDFLLNNSDKYLLEDFPLGDVKMDDILAYRQALRDLPDSISEIPEDGMDGVKFPENPVE